MLPRSTSRRIARQQSFSAKLLLMRTHPAWELRKVPTREASAPPPPPQRPAPGLPLRGPCRLNSRVHAASPLNSLWVENMIIALASAFGKKLFLFCSHPSGGGERGTGPGQARSPDEQEAGAQRRCRHPSKTRIFVPSELHGGNRRIAGVASTVISAPRSWRRMPLALSSLQAGEREKFPSDFRFGYRI